jgi:hypothetical protein
MHLDLALVWIAKFNHVSLDGNDGTRPLVKSYISCSPGIFHSELSWENDYGRRNSTITFADALQIYLQGRNALTHVSHLYSYS